AGFTLSADGALSGSTTVAGTSSFTITATDQSGLTGSQAYTFTAGVAPQADLQVLITNLNPTSVLAGQSYSYVVTTFNLGPQNATNVNLVDHLGDGSYDNLITGGVLAAGNLQTITLTRTAVSGQATDTVTVTANEIDRTSTDNSVSITETVVPLSQLT